MAIGRVYVGSVGPFLFDDTATYSTEDTVLGGGAVGAVVTDSPISVGSLRLFDTDTSNVLDIVWNENDSADRTFNLLVRGATRSLDLYESLKVVDGQDIELHASGGEKAQLAIDTQNAERTLDMSGNLTVEANSIINQDLSSDSATAQLANLGVGISADVDMGVYVSKTFSDTDNSGKAALRGVAYVGKVSQNGVTPMTSAGWGVYGQVYLAAANTQNWTHDEAGLRGICGFVGTESGSAGTVTNAANIFALASIHASGGTITNLHGIHICTPTVGGSKVTNEYGVYICDQNTGATLNYAIYTNAGIVRFGGALNLATCAAAGTDTDKFLVLDATGNVDYRTDANVLADLSGDAGAAFSFNSQALTNVGAIGCGTVTSTGNVVIADAGSIGSVSDTDAIAISAAGSLTFSGQNGFTVSLSANQDIPNGEITLVEFDTEEDDVQSEFNTGTYTFTATVAGKYYVAALLRYAEQIGDGKDFVIYIYKNGANYMNVSIQLGGNSAAGLCLSGRLALVATDTLNVRTYHGHTEARQLESTACRFSIARIA